MDYRTRTIDTVKEIDRNAWNRATRGPYFSYEWFEYVEEVCLNDFTPQYVVCYADNRLVGVLPAFHVKSSDNMYEKLLFGRLKSVLQRVFVFKRKPLLCIPPFSGGAFTFADNGYDANILDHLLTGALDAARRQRNSEVVFMFVKETETTLIDRLKTHGYGSVFLNKVGMIYNRFERFEDYLKSLPRNRRKSVKADMTSFRKSSYTITASRDKAPDAALICELKDNVERKHQSQVRPYSPEKVNACAQKMAAYSTFYAVRNGDETIAVITLFEKDRIINTHAFGIDFERARKNGAYFNLLYYNTIKEMIARRARYVNFNPLAYKVKESRGCNLVPQYMYIRVLKGRFWIKPWLSLLDKQYRKKFETIYEHARATHAPSKAMDKRTGSV